MDKKKITWMTFKHLIINVLISVFYTDSYFYALIFNFGQKQESKAYYQMDLSSEKSIYDLNHVIYKVAEMDF